ncbi:hypothetical protein EFA69_06070 [Rufibacter immobilis]|uniref:Uncharacterized protein n=1 Tax=Rufibacter immobilis TaxID=1348778 RepID=A0A3M9N3K0_9BACT|nr:hypothetical protein EFA69_06070 [Rufibacter immobilis]
MFTLTAKGLAFCVTACNAKPAQQLQIHSGEHKSAAGEWSSESVSWLMLVCAGVSPLGAASAQGIHDITVMNTLRSIANHFIRHKINKK